MRRLWREDVVLQVLATDKGLQQAINQAKRKKEKKRAEIEKADRFLEKFSPEDMILQGKELSRRFVLHVGPTNSGKTYGALCALKAAENGVYLGPLRLLALEVFETFNSEGYGCTLLTGEEYSEIPFSRYTASTIELCDFTEHYQVAVIDEAQMIADSFRGDRWLQAICLVDAEEVHICLAPEALPLIENLVKRLGSSYEIIHTQRLVPLEFAGAVRSIEEAQPGDAFIVFSRKKVLNLAAELEKKGFKCSVIYGALPPASRKEEVRRFAEGETKYVVATDAIGMGISLPIKRIIFVEIEKYDGTGDRVLTPAEIKQIAGRAGRYKKYDLGQVLTMSDPNYVEECLDQKITPIRKLRLGFPQEALLIDYPLDKLLAQWDTLPGSELFERTDMSDAEFLLKSLGKVGKAVSKELLYSMITCPVDIKNDTLVGYWKDCCGRILVGLDPVKPEFPTETLDQCEVQYRAYDIYHQMMRRINVEDPCLKEKEELCEKINTFLKKEKNGFLRKCRICGKPLGVAGKYNICDDCFHRQKQERYFARSEGQEPHRKRRRRKKGEKHSR
ncbi:MAG: helicase [Firmicutes bacterium]|nr:helicase [Bacillota bacterium]